MLVKLDITTDVRDDAVSALRRLGEAARWADGDLSSCLCGFSARFFRGALCAGRDASVTPLRFGLTRRMPTDLGRMNARDDERFAAFRTDALLASKESDLLMLAEATQPASLDAWREHLLAVVRASPLRPVGVEVGFVGKGERNHFGQREGVSNLQWLRRHAPEAYQRAVYVTDGAAGESDYDGGSYLVYRKYVYHVDRWREPQLTIRDRQGRVLVGDDARTFVTGRSLQTDLVVDGETGEPVAPEDDEAQAIRAAADSHIRKANPRGRGYTNFGMPITVPDLRILRRGFSFEERGEAGRLVRCGQLFLCFQADIRRRGFEFIHNEWLMSKFQGRRDPLLDPELQLVEPTDGCYYFVPPPGAYPGVVFFEGSR